MKGVDQVNHHLLWNVSKVQLFYSVSQIGDVVLLILYKFAGILNLFFKLFSHILQFFNRFFLSCINFKSKLGTEEFNPFPTVTVSESELIKLNRIYVVSFKTNSNISKLSWSKTANLENFIVLSLKDPININFFRPLASSIVGKFHIPKEFLTKL